MSTWSSVGIAVLLVLVVVLALCLRIVQQYQRGVVFRFGRVLGHVREPGLQLLVPFADRMVKVSTQVVVLAVAPQGAITRDNVTVEVDAAVYFRVVDPVKAIVNVQDYTHAVSQVAQTSLRTIIGRADLDTLLSDRDRISAELKAVIDAPTEQPWGVRIELVELKDISLPESMKRSMSRQAEAERERRARVIAADGERQASEQLAAAAAAMAHTPGAMHLRLLQTVADVAVEKNSTLVMPFPVELLRFFGHSDPDGAAPSVTWERAPGTASPARPVDGPEPGWFAPAEPTGSPGARAGSPTGAGPDGDR
ncbi:SPFH domain-containing protein [Pseudonocardia alni]|uniref:SPFH domain-containing protein n=1 Tax=Pseudonocardia alni TaxID=33907 RepID=UPI003324D3F2